MSGFCLMRTLLDQRLCQEDCARTYRKAIGNSIHRIWGCHSMILEVFNCGRRISKLLWHVACGCASSSDYTSLF
jgi:hypothetical protein